jgi:hypothetical protein
LNNVFGARLRITALRAAQGPGIELLEYLAPRDGRPAPPDLGSNDIAHWQTTLVTESPDRVMSTLSTRLFSLVSPTVISPKSPELGLNSAVLLRDPDGHGVRLASKGSRSRISLPLLLLLFTPSARGTSSVRAASAPRE